jgi:hypothetical protein
MYKDYNLLAEKLTDAFVQYQWRLENPMPIPYKTPDEINMHYLTDSMFHAKVDSLVAGVLHIVQEFDKHA